ncbi:TOMM precursor leader peptide-binding protein [Bradyrhizobium sp. BRP22]|uniref:TOMM precursor leader peptide-binding protein n=1 Tax=Bradyrhizobium sp. BRP22 TaxID=2793821 RepID=UPI001CD77AB4|nr:TOMM precursor leader peptide-binding protein [Bradyrhizobium sp. BRP22]MCA1458227.1 TOMM precursor leader peptide-binding protein [Bradyrhizobium sp. BRP22]
MTQFCVDAQRAEEIVKGSALVVACAEFGGSGLLKPWNALAFQQSKPFLPVLIEDATIRLGPLVIPEQTACLACLEVRQNSHLREKVHDQRLIEAFLPQGQAFIGAHPAVTSIACKLAAFEILRFSANLFPRRAGKLIEMNLMGSSMIASCVLKAPRCPVCSPLRHASKVNLEKISLNRERWAQVEAMGGRNDAD